MIAVRAAEIVGAMRVHRDDQIGPPAPDLAGDVAPQIAGVLDLAIGVAQERDVRDAERARGVALLLLPDARQALGGHRPIARALVAVGHDDVRDLAPAPDELRDGPAGPELGVVGVRRHHQHALDLLGHGLSVVAGSSRPAWTEGGLREVLAGSARPRNRLRRSVSRRSLRYARCFVGCSDSGYRFRAAWEQL